LVLPPLATAPAAAAVRAIVKSGALVVKGDDVGSDLTIDAAGSVRVTPGVRTPADGSGAPAKGTNALTTP
jgi:hypothetical protein